MHSYLVQPKRLMIAYSYCMFPRGLAFCHQFSPVALYLRAGVHSAASRSAEPPRVTQTHWSRMWRLASSWARARRRPVGRGSSPPARGTRCCLSHHATDHTYNTKQYNTMSMWEDHCVWQSSWPHKGFHSYVSQQLTAITYSWVLVSY